MLPRPISPYGVSKLAAENYVQVFNEFYGLETVSMRYFNVYGPRQGFASGYSGFNIGSGTATTVCELAKILQQITDTTRLKPIFAESRAGDIKHCSGDIYKAEEILGFHPKIQLEDGLSKLVEWHRHSMRAIEESVL